MAVFGQNLGAGLAEPVTVLLQARQYDVVAVIHMRTAKTRDVPHAGVAFVLLLLRRRRRNHQNKRNNEKKSGHDVTPTGHYLDSF
jgi:hypothetical protein